MAERLLDFKEPEIPAASVFDRTALDCTDLKETTMAKGVLEEAEGIKHLRASGDLEAVDASRAMTLVPVELSIVMPCLNEVRTLAACIRKARRFLNEHGVSGEIIVADNGSTDGSVELAASLGVRVLSICRRGYGAALKGGIEAARGRWVIMGDSDDSYDFSALQLFLDRLRAGDDLVVGNRYGGGIAPGAMPFLHRYLGNPCFSWWLRTIVGAPLRDVYCGLRGFRREAIEYLDLHSEGMEFALEMIIKSKLHGMRISEVPTTLACDGRDRPPHLNTWRDGRRSLLLLLASQPQIRFFRAWS